MIHVIWIVLLTCFWNIFPALLAAGMAQENCIASKHRLCGSQVKSISETPEIVVTVMNWWDWGPNQGERMEAWVERAEYTGRDFALFGMSELHSDMRADYEPIPMACPGSAEQLMASECLVRLLNQTQGGRGTIRYAGEQYREDGIVHSADHVERISDWITVNLPRRSILGVESILGRGQTSQKVMVGARFRLKGTGHTFHMYATHLDTAACWKCRIKQVRTLTAAVRQHYISGDLPPIVVGDFNDSIPEASSYWSDRTEHLDVRAEMERYFEDAGARFGHQRIDHVWVGKADRFSGASGQWNVIDFDIDEQVRNPIPLLNGKAMQISPHATIVARLRPSMPRR